MRTSTSLYAVDDIAEGLICGLALRRREAEKRLRAATVDALTPEPLARWKNFLQRPTLVCEGGIQSTRDNSASCIYNTARQETWGLVGGLSGRVTVLKQICFTILLTNSLLIFRAHAPLIKYSFPVNVIDFYYLYSSIHPLMTLYSASEVFFKPRRVHY